MTDTYDRGAVEDFGRWREFSAGMWAWILHKFTGWLLVGYLFTHIAVLSTATAADPAVYTETLRGLEALLVVRLLFVDLGIGLDRQATTFYVTLFVTAAITVASVPTYLAGV